MNKIIFFIGIICFLLVLNSCEQKIDTWSGSDVAYMDMDADSTLVAFAYLDSDVDTVNITVAVMGEVASKNVRSVRINVVAENAVENKDYESLKSIYELGKGETFCTIPVVIKRPSDDSEKAITIELVENEDFHLYYIEDVLSNGSSIKFAKTEHRILFNTLMKEPPSTWNEYYFGKFSVKKYETICTVMEISKNQFLSQSYMSFGRLRFIAPYMKEYLDQYPETDEDGSLMKMGDYLYV